MRGRSAAWACAGAFILVALGGCGTAVEIPEGIFACETAADCPDGFECRDARCYRRGALDAGVEDDAGADGGSPDDAG